MESAWQGTVLLADAHGPRGVARCIDALAGAARAGGGEVLRTKPDELMVLFPAPAAAARAAAAMQAAASALPETAAGELGVRIAFHQGPVLLRDGDVLGDTVKLASRLLERARKAQILTSRATAAQLGVTLTEAAKAEALAPCELVWRRPASTESLKLRYGTMELLRAGAQAARIVIGRGFDCDLSVLDDLASRRHCTIQRRGEQFVLEDHSSNGTYVSPRGGAERLVHGASLVLAGQGVIACGQTRARTGQLIEYFCR